MADDGAAARRREHAGRLAVIADPDNERPAQAGDRGAAPRFDEGRATDQSADPGQQFHVWEIDEDEPWAIFYRSDAGFTVRFPGYADFAVSCDGATVVCHACPGLTPATRDHLFQNQVMPLVRGLRGQAIFHASAVDVSGGAIAFLAASGFGKSTLAAAFSARGHPILTDDALILHRKGTGYVVEPGIPNVRLWQDSEDALFPGPVSAADPVSFTEKRAVVGSDTLKFRSSAVPLRAAFVLGEGSAPGIRIDPVIGAAAAIEWVRHSFVMDIYDQETRARHFGDTTEIAGAVPLYQLDFPRRYDFLDDVVQHLVAHVREAETKR